MKKQIQDFNFFYVIFNPVVAAYARFHYREAAIRGRENLPKDGCYILAPCHQNALMEPLAVLYMMHTKPTVFLARADIFQKPVANFFLTFLKIMPVYRIRDGKRNLSKNNEIFDKSRQVLLSGTPLCLMAEGRHNDRHQLLPLVKGMFRIAGETQRSLGDKPLYIVPVGIDFDEYERPYANLVVNIGQAIPVQPFMPMFEENEPVALNQMRDALTGGLLSVMHDIRSKEHYDEFYTVCNILNKQARSDRRLRSNAWNRFQMRRELSHRLDAIEASDADKTDRLCTLAHEYSDICRRLNVREKQPSECWPVAVLLAYTLLTAAFVALLCQGGNLGVHARWFVLAWVLCQPLVYLPIHLIPKKIIKDPQFRSSINYGIHTFVGFFYSIVMAIVVGCMMGWQYGLLFFAGSFVCARCAATIVGSFRDFLANWHYRLLQLFRRKDTKRLDAIRHELASLLK